MNRRPKVVFSRTLDTAHWHNTTLAKSGLLDQLRAMKQTPGENIVILGSGSIGAQLAAAGLIDYYMIVVSPIALGDGVSLFAGIPQRLDLTLTQTRTFANGNVVLGYRPLP